MIQEMVDQVFSYGELGIPGVRDLEVPHRASSRRTASRCERGVAGIPTAFVARWGSGKPVISLGSDIDGIPQADQQAGRRLPRPDHRAGAPGHGEGHNSGMPLNIAAAHRGEEDHGAREDPGHARALAGRRRGADGGQGVPRARRRVQGRGRHALHARRQRPRRVVGPVEQQRAHLGASSSSRAPARTRPARRGAARARSTP